jgi:hypothetical protein
VKEWHQLMVKKSYLAEELKDEKKSAFHPNEDISLKLYNTYDILKEKQ